MKKEFNIIFLFIIIIALAVISFLYLQKDKPEITSFEECIDNYPVLESYPRQCITPAGENFVEDIGNELEKTDLIRIDNPRPNQSIETPLVITGQARGYWFFEGDFPVKLLDKNDNVIAIGFVSAQDEWMTEDFVSFKGELEFTSDTGQGILVLEKDNPSGLPEHADELRVPIVFK